MSECRNKTVLKVILYPNIFFFFPRRMFGQHPNNFEQSKNTAICYFMFLSAG